MNENEQESWIVVLRDSEGGSTDGVWGPYSSRAEAEQIASECLDFEMELENIQDPSDTIDMDFTFEARPIYRRSAQMISEDINA